MISRIAFGVIVLTVGVGSYGVAETCSALPPNKDAALVNYVQRKYRLDERTGLKVIKEQFVQGSCYREITFEGKSAVKSWQLTLFLSADGRFLTSELFDTEVDPVVEEHKKEQALMAGLSPNTGSSSGPVSAPVTIVEFSDFECPFCRKFAEIANQVLPEEKNRVRIVFHHFPLQMHSWAREAAEGAACAQLQSSEAFWHMHDQLFQNQPSITPANVKQKLREFAQADKNIDFGKFEACLQNKMSLGLVFQDANLASTNNVQATPTLFINGHRVAGIKDAVQLRQLIAEAEKEAGEADGSLKAGLLP